MRTHRLLSSPVRHSLRSWHGVAIIALVLLSPYCADAEFDAEINGVTSASFDIEWPLAEGFVDTVQVSDDLLNWRAIPGSSFRGSASSPASGSVAIIRSEQPKRSFFRIFRITDPGISITEFMAVNDATIPGPDGLGDAPDWIELYNGGADPVSLEGYFLTDTKNDLSKWRFPDLTLEPGEFMVVYATGNDQRDLGAGTLETDFQLERNGGYLALVAPDGNAILSEFGGGEFGYPEQFEDVSYGLAFVTSTPNGIEIPEHVVAQWNMDEATPLTDAAAGGSGSHTVTVTGMSYSQMGLVDDGGSSIGFGGTGGTPETANAADLGVASNGQLTAEGFFQITDAEAGSGLNYIMGSRRITTGWAIWLRDGGKLAFVLDGTGGLIGTDFFGKTFVDDGLVHHFALVLDKVGGTNPGTGRATLYLDSVVEHVMDNIPANHIDADDGFYIGRRHNSHFGGQLDVLRVSNVALSPEEFLKPENFTGGTGAPTGQPRGIAGYQRDPSPAAPNGTTENTGPWIFDVTHTPDHGTAGEDILVTARISPRHAPVADVTLAYRTMFEAGQPTVPMTDAGDGTFTATIPSTAFAGGDMVRWFVRATDTDGNTSRKPEFLRPIESGEYFGTVIQDPSLPATTLPVLDFFVPDATWYREGSSNNRDFTQASLYYRGEFIDNLRIRTRGRTAANAIKPNFKFDFFNGGHFKVLADAGRVEEMNLNGFHGENIWSRSFMRSVFTYRILRENGVPTPYSFHTHVRRNGEFFGLCAMEEQIDRDFLRRNDLNDDGALYKASGNGNLLKTYPEGDWSKETPDDVDFSDLTDFIQGISPSLSLAERETFVFDNVTVPVMINYLATFAVTLNHDRIQHNYYMYRDSGRSDEWTMIPWDVDRSFSEGAQLTDARNTNIYYGDSDHWRVASSSDVYNRLYDALFDIPRTRAMYQRRLRSLVDEWHGASSAKLKSTLAELSGQVTVDAALDEAKWGNNRLANGNSGITNSLNTRRGQLAGVADIPPASVIAPGAIDFGQVESNPASGNQDEEFVELQNMTAESIDISNWQLRGGITHGFIPGTVIPARESLYVSPDLRSFRARPNSPTGGQGLFVQGDYRGHLSNFGELVELVDASGTIVSSVTTPNDPSETQRFLRVSEIMFNPPAPSPDEIAAGFTDNDDFEFIEVVNTGAEELSLDGVAFTSGIDYSFPAGIVLAPGARLVVPRNLAAFEQRYSTALDTTTEYRDPADGSKQLQNSGETIKLDDPDNSTILDFRYEDKATEGWYDETDGNGSSLEIIDAGADVDLWGDPSSWRPSATIGGSPGA